MLAARTPHGVVPRRFPLPVGWGRHRYADPVLRAMSAKSANATATASMVALLGPKGAEVTVGQLLRMQSGIQDFDTPACDDPVLEQGTSRHSPLEWVECMTRQFNATERFACEPGGCTMYSSTNYVFAGLVLAGATIPPAKLAAAGGDAWTLLDQTTVLPGDAGRWAHSRFMDTGVLSSHLTTPGTTHDPAKKGGVTELHGQDASILGWTMGNMVTTSLEARPHTDCEKREREKRDSGVGGGIGGHRLPADLRSEAACSIPCSVRRSPAQPRRPYRSSPHPLTPVVGPTDPPWYALVHRAAGGALLPRAAGGALRGLAGRSRTDGKDDATVDRLGQGPHPVRHGSDDPRPLAQDPRPADPRPARGVPRPRRRQLRIPQRERARRCRG